MDHPCRPHWPRGRGSQSGNTDMGHAGRLRTRPFQALPHAGRDPDQPPSRRNRTHGPGRMVSRRTPDPSRRSRAGRALPTARSICKHAGRLSTTTRPRQKARGSRDRVHGRAWASRVCGRTTRIQRGCHETGQLRPPIHHHHRGRDHQPHGEVPEGGPARGSRSLHRAARPDWSPPRPPWAGAHKLAHR